MLEPWLGTWSGNVYVTCFNEHFGRLKVKTNFSTSGPPLRIDGIYELSTIILKNQVGFPVYKHELKDRYFFMNDIGQYPMIGVSHTMTIVDNDYLHGNLDWLSGKLIIKHKNLLLVLLTIYIFPI